MTETAVVESMCYFCAALLARGESVYHNPADDLDYCDEECAKKQRRSDEEAAKIGERWDGCN